MRLYEVSVKKRVLLVPIGDIQFTGTDPAISGGCSVRYLRYFLAQVTRIARDLKAEIRWIGTGDYTDLISPSNRAGYLASGLYSPAKRVISDAVHDVVEELHGILKEFIRGRDIVTLCRGHHWFLYDDSLELPYRDTDKHLAALFGLAKRDDRGVCEAAGLASVQFESGAVYRVLFQHGQGNGQSLAYGLNKLDKLAGAWEEVDAHVMGHTHKSGAIKKAKLRVQDGEIVHRDVRLITSGAFLRGWVEGEVLYPEEKQLGAIPLGGSALFVEADSSHPSGHHSFSIDI